MKIWFDSLQWRDPEIQRKADCSCGDTDCGCESRHTSGRALPSSLSGFPHQENLYSLVSQHLSLTQDLYIQPCSDMFWLVCHPTGNGQIAVMDTSALTLLQSFQGSAEVRSEISGELQTIAVFLALGFLHAGDIPTLPAGGGQRETLFAWIHLTNACNLRCHYCYIAKSSEHMAERTSQLAVDAVIRSAIQEGYRSVELIYAGGEASLRWPQLLALHNYAVQQTSSHGLRLAARLLSNGVALSRRAIEQIKQYDISVMISLDGIGPVHDQQRPLLNGSGSFALVDRTISRLLEQQCVPFINVTVSARTIDALPDLIAYLLERDLPFTLSYYRENDCSLSFADLSYSNESMILGMRAVFAYIEQHLPERSLCNGLIDKGNMLSPGSHVCGVGRNYLVIDQRGGVAKCHADIRQTITTIHAENPLAVINRDKNGVQAVPVEKKEGCHTCTWRSWCRGGCPTLTYRFTGRNDVRSPNCSIYQALYPDVLRLEALRLLKYTQPLICGQDEEDRSRDDEVGACS